MSLISEEEVTKNWTWSKGIIVSIDCTTFNHENYIRDALNGFIMQKTNFPFEILVHDDASTDRTVEFISEYEVKYPQIIKPIYQKENQYTQGGSISGRFQFPRAKGKYIAICEGDDYWTDPLKLQKQVDFLENNLEYSASAHQAKVIYENNFGQSRLFKEGVNEVIELVDLLGERIFHTASIVFKSELIRNYTFSQNITAGDRSLYLLLSSFGKIRFLPEIMCVYRKNDGGISSWVSVDQMKNDLNIIPWIYSINSKFPRNRYKSFIYKTIFTYPPNISYWNIFKYFTLYAFYSFSFFPENIKPVLVCTIKTLPQIIKKKKNSHANI